MPEGAVRDAIVADKNPDALKLAGRSARTRPCSPTVIVVAVQDLTGGGATVVLDFVAEQGAEMDGWNMTGSTAPTSSSATAASCIPTAARHHRHRANIVGNIVGTYTDLAELMVLQAGKVTLHTQQYPSTGPSTP